MRRALIAFFSQGGTTETIANKISLGLQTDRFQVDMFNVTNGQIPSVESYDLIGVGTPVYIFRPPFIVMDFIKSLPQLNGLPFFVFILYGAEAGTAGNIVRKALAKKGGKEVGFEKYKGADFFLGYLQRGHLFSPDNPKEDEQNRAVKFGSGIAGRIGGNHYVKPGWDKLPPFVYSFERLITTRVQVKQIYSRFFKFDKENCTSCKLCAQNCPKGNITFDENDLPIWGRNCMACFYCQMKCPLDAVTSAVDWPIMAPLINYNVKRVLNDPAIEKAAVVHRKGRTVRI